MKNTKTQPRHSQQQMVTPIGKRGRMPTFAAKIGSMSSAEIVVKRDRRFAVGQRIAFANTYDMRGMCIGVKPPWRNGTIWKIEDDRLFVSLV